MANIHFPFCEDVNKYQKLIKIGQGTFGEVFKARDIKSGQFVALKKILMEKETEGFPITAIREIRILKLLNNDNLVKLIEVVSSKESQNNGKHTNGTVSASIPSTFYLVFEFCDHDLAGLLANSNVRFNLGEIKMIMKQLLDALFFIHTNHVLHRDLKASNVLLTKSGKLKLADFGLARAYSKRETRYTNRVVTLWYRPPELLLGQRNYGPQVDLWGAGCIMAELWTRTPILQGKSEIEQLTLIAKLCGSITLEVWPDVGSLPNYGKMELPKAQPRRVTERLKHYLKDNYACNLLDTLLTLDPLKRKDAGVLLDHDFFWKDPMPCDLSNVMSSLQRSMFEYNAPSRVPGANVQQLKMLKEQQTDSISTFRDRVY